MSQFSELVKINRFNLPEECERHAGLYHQIAEARADYQAELDRLKDAFQLHKAEKEIKIRADWNVDADGKQTESGVAAKLASLESVLARQDEIRVKTKELAVLDAAKSAFEHRKSMLNNLTSLLIGGFYAAPEGGVQEGKSSAKERTIRRKMKKSREQEADDFDE